MTSEIPEESRTASGETAGSETREARGARRAGLEEASGETASSDFPQENRNASGEGERRPASEERKSRGTVDERAAETMADVSHTHPHADRGTVNRPFERGPTVVVDGGRREAVGERDASAAEDADAEDDRPNESSDAATMTDVDHTPPEGAGDANEVFERGPTNRTERRERDEP